jgi:hypothetical protein
MRRKIGADRILALFAHIESFTTAVEARHFFHHDTGFFGVEQTREKQIALFVKLLVLRCGQFHMRLLKTRIQNSVNYRYFPTPFLLRNIKLGHNVPFVVT